MPIQQADTNLMDIISNKIGSYATGTRCSSSFFSKMVDTVSIWIDKGGFPQKCRQVQWIAAGKDSKPEKYARFFYEYQQCQENADSLAGNLSDEANINDPNQFSDGRVSIQDIQMYFVAHIFVNLYLNNPWDEDEDGCILINYETCIGILFFLNPEVLCCALNKQLELRPKRWVYKYIMNFSKLFANRVICKGFVNALVNLKEIYEAAFAQVKNDIQKNHLNKKMYRRQRKAIRNALKYNIHVFKIGGDALDHRIFFEYCTLHCIYEIERSLCEWYKFDYAGVNNGSIVFFEEICGKNVEYVQKELNRLMGFAENTRQSKRRLRHIIGHRNMRYYMKQRMEEK